jgi:hypothetical protein
MKTIIYSNLIFVLFILSSFTFTSRITNKLIWNEYCEEYKKENRETIINIKSGLSEVKKEVHFFLIFSGKSIKLKI